MLEEGQWDSGVEGEAVARVDDEQYRSSEFENKEENTREFYSYSFWEFKARYPGYLCQRSLVVSLLV